MIAISSYTEELNKAPNQNLQPALRELKRSWRESLPHDLKNPPSQTDWLFGLGLTGGALFGYYPSPDSHDFARLVVAGALHHYFQEPARTRADFDTSWSIGQGSELREDIATLTDKVMDHSLRLCQQQKQGEAETLMSHSLWRSLAGLRALVNRFRPRDSGKGVDRARGFAFHKDAGLAYAMHRQAQGLVTTPDGREIPASTLPSPMRHDACAFERLLDQVMAEADAT